MADKSKIEWTDATWNPIRGCSRVSEGCRNCYAERIAVRFSGPGQPYEGLAEYRMEPTGVRDDLDNKAHWTGDVRFIPELLEQPLHWRRPRKIFVNSMSDLFHEKVPIEWVARIYDVMASATADCGKNHKHDPECWCGDPHTYQILTKRPARMLKIINQLPEYFSEHFDGESPCNLAHEVKNGWPLPNVWLGVSVEDQQAADERIPLLLQTPAAVRWVSYEPALGPVDFASFYAWDQDYASGTYTTRACPLDQSDPRHLDWIVAGGESGPGARPAHPDWFRGARDQCQAAGVPFFFKQWGEWRAVRDEQDRLSTKQQLVQLVGQSWMIRHGKRGAGRLLDGREWSEFPNDRK